MKKFAFLISILCFLSCEKDDKKTHSIISGTIENNSAENVIISGTDFEAEIPISADGTFSDTLDLKYNGFYLLYVGREQTGIYLEKGQDLNVKLNTEHFDESLEYSGDLAGPNNYLAKKYLWNEQHLDYMELFSADENAFID